MTLAARKACGRFGLLLRTRQLQSWTVARFKASGINRLFSQMNRGRPPSLGPSRKVRTTQKNELPGRMFGPLGGRFLIMMPKACIRRRGPTNRLFSVVAARSDRPDTDAFEHELERASRQPRQAHIYQHSTQNVPARSTSDTAQRQARNAL